MTNTILTKSFDALVVSQFEEHQWLSREYGKVKSVLKAFTEHKGISFSHLTLLDVSDDRNSTDINSGLRKFIDRLKKPSRYQRECRSRLRRILGVFFPDASNNQQPSEDNPISLPVPEFFEEVLPHLPRQHTSAVKGRPAVLSTDQAKRLEQPLTQTGQQLFSVLLRVVEDYSINDLNTLFIEHRSHIYDTIKQSLPPNRWQATNCALFALKRKLGYHETIIIKQSVDYEDWPSKLKSQFARFRELAPQGIDHDHELIKLAAENGIEVVPLESSTIKLYEQSISYGLFHILPHLDEGCRDLEIRDFLRLERYDYMWEGEPRTRFINPLVEIYREHEKRKSTRDKGERFDSAQFLHFIHAIKAVAVFNGFFGFHRNFNDNYRFIIDFKRRKEKKRFEKEVFDREWIDNEIRRMLPIFNKIVRKRAFEFENNKKGFSYHDSQKNMRFCLFFVLLVVLRYMGHRQQQIRNCKVNRNIFFSSDGSIRFNWKEYLIKNDVELDQLLTREYETHKLLIKVLSKYYHSIYLPYIKKHCVTDPDGTSLLHSELFVCINHACKFRPFNPTRHKDFYAKFQGWSLEFMEFGDRANVMKRGLHPHYFRGLAVDWLVNEKKVTIEKAADYFGISVKTLIKHYLQESPKKSSTAALESANADHKNTITREELRKTKAELEVLQKEYRDEMSRKDALLEKERERVYQLQNELIAAYKPGSNSLTA